MALNLIVGGTNTGKAERLSGLLAGAARDSQPVLLLPSAPDSRATTQELAERGILGIRVATMDEWVNSLWLLHGDGRRMVGPAARVALLEQALEGTPLDDMATSASTPGFPLLFADIVKRAAGPVVVSGGGVSREMGALIEAYRLVAAASGLIEPGEAAAALAAIAPDPGGVVGVARFTDLTPAQERLLVSISSRRDVHIALTWEKGSAATEALTPLVERMVGAGATVEQPGERGAEVCDLERLAANLFEGGPALPVPRAIEFAEAAGSDAECALIASRVRSLIDEGTPAEAIAVAFRRIEDRVSIITAALSAADVPAHADVSLAFSRTPFGGAVTALMDASAGRGAVHARLLAFLMSPYSGGESDDVVDADRSWRKDRVSGEALLASAKARIAGSRTALVLASELAASRLTEASAHKWQKLAGLLFANAHDGQTGGDAAEVDAAAHRALLEAVSELAELDRGLGEGDLSRALRSVRVSTGRARAEGHVLVTEAHRLRGRRFDIVVLGGLTSDEFDVGVPDSLAASLAHQLGQPASVDRGLLERSLFHAVVTRPRKRLVLARQATDEQGGAIRASSFYEEVLDLYRTPEEAADGLLPDGLEMRTLALANLAEAAPAYLKGRRAQRSRPEECAPRRVDRGRLSDQRVLTELAERDEFSASEIELYLACPYRWFFDRALRLDELEQAFDARERGNLAHALLKTFYDRWLASGHSRISPETLDDAIGLLDDVAADPRALSGRTEAQGAAEALSAARAKAWAQAILQDDVTFAPGFEPVHHELVFGKAHGAAVEFGGVFLKGSVDRVDRGRTGLLVTDYKSGRTVQGRNSLESAGLLQLPVYAAAAAQLTGERVVGAVYRSMSSLAARGFWVGGAVDLCSRGSARDEVDADEMTALIESAEAHLREAVEGIRAGRIDPAPRTPRSCENCGARAVCEAGR